jgi:hypothetical protein
MRSHAAPIGIAGGHHKPHPNGSCPPPTLEGDLRGEPAFAVERAHQLIHVGDVRLDLDDQHGTTARVPGKDVDDSALAEDGERDLRLGHPARQVCEQSREFLVHGRVARVQQAVEIAGAPAWSEIDPNVEGSRHLTNHVEGNLAEMTPLQARHGGSRHAGRRREVLLSPAPTNPNRPDRIPTR